MAQARPAPTQVRYSARVRRAPPRFELTSDGFPLRTGARAVDANSAWPDSVGGRPCHGLQPTQIIGGFVGGGTVGSGVRRTAPAPPPASASSAPRRAVGGASLHPRSPHPRSSRVGGGAGWWRAARGTQTATSALAAAESRAVAARKEAFEAGSGPRQRCGGHTPPATSRVEWRTQRHLEGRPHTSAGGSATSILFEWQWPTKSFAPPDLLIAQQAR